MVTLFGSRCPIKDTFPRERTGGKYLMLDPIVRTRENLASSTLAPMPHLRAVNDPHGIHSYKTVGTATCLHHNQPSHLGYEEATHSYRRSYHSVLSTPRRQPKVDGLVQDIQSTGGTDEQEPCLRHSCPHVPHLRAAENPLRISAGRASATNVRYAYLSRGLPVA